MKIGAVPAPFGKGLNSVVNSSLSKAWQIHAAKVSVSSNGNNDFNSRTIPALTNLALNRLGLLNNAVPVEAHLFQVLLYEPGGHFVKHRNFAKEPGNLCLKYFKLEYFVKIATLFLSASLSFN